MAFNISQLKRRIFKYRVRPQYKQKFTIGITVISSLILISLIAGPISRAVNSLKNPVSTGKVKVDWYKDLNAVHLRHAKARGISPLKSSHDFHKKVDDLVDRGRLVKIKNTKYYTIKHLTHSHPYLNPIAKDFLDDLGKRYRQKLKKNGMGTYLFQISSLLRTKESQKSLSKSNVNASSNTAHLYGLTLDIAYKNVVKKPLPWMKVEVADAKAVKLLSETIGEMRREGRCVVVTERIEKCFHITVIR